MQSAAYWNYYIDPIISTSGISALLQDFKLMIPLRWERTIDLWGFSLIGELDYTPGTFRNVQLFFSVQNEE